MRLADSRFERASLPRPSKASFLGFLLLITLLVASEAWAGLLHGRVIAVADGDTLTVLDEGFRQHKVRIVGIDAPERGQPFGNRSRQSLASLALRKEVDVEWAKTDRYGRIVGQVTVHGQDVGLEQVRRGMAWHFKTYEREQSIEERQAYSAAEDEARGGSLGLWRDREPEPPWEYRRRHR